MRQRREGREMCLQKRGPRPAGANLNLCLASSSLNGIHVVVKFALAGVFTPWKSQALQIGLISPGELAGKHSLAHHQLNSLGKWCKTQAPQSSHPYPGGGCRSTCTKVLRLVGSFSVEC